MRDDAEMTGRFHDNRHTLITELAESGAGDQTIMDIAGHVSKQMLKHYSHIGMEAKRRALESIANKSAVSRESELHEERGEGSIDRSQGSGRNNDRSEVRPIDNADSTETAKQQYSDLPANTRGFEGESLQKSLQSCNFEGHRGVGRDRKLLKGIGSSGRTRTYNPSVNRTINNVLSMTYAERLAA